MNQPDLPTTDGLKRPRVWQGPHFTLGCMLIIAFLCASFSDPDFLSWPILEIALTTFFVELAFITIAQTLVILVRGIDLSAGGMVALSAVTLGYSHTHGVNIWLAVALCIVVGVSCGVINGCLVTVFRTPPMIATLGSGLLYLGIAKGVTRGRSYTGFPEAFQGLAHGHLGPLPNQLVILVVLAVVVHVILSRTRFGRYIYAIGGNPLAARFSGIRVNTVVISLYAASGLLAAIAGVILSARLLSAGPQLAIGIELASITAALLGGVSIMGGRGTIAGAMLGMLLITIARSGMTLSNITSTVQQMTIAFLLLIAIVVDMMINSRKA
jgi:rhamnose transport system permease protein